MGEDYTIKAVFIGVSVFVTMTILVLVLNYYNTAKQIANKINLKMDIPDTFDYIMKNYDALDDKISGAELQALIRKYANREDISINIISISGHPDAEGIEENINNTWFDKELGIVNELELSKINPSWVNLVEKEVTDNHITLNVSLDYRLDVLL